MKKYLMMAALLLAAVPAAKAGDNDFRGRLSAEVEKKVTKGLRLSLEEEIRFEDNLSQFDRFNTTLGLTYRAAPWLRIGVGYTNIYQHKTYSSSDKENYWQAKHRFSLDVTERFKPGDWTLSFKERIYMTHTPGDSINVYQTPRNLANLKLRAMAKYRGLDAPITPYLFVEARFILNGVKGSTSGSVQTNSSGKSYYAWTHDGYSDFYMNRFRTGVGLEWNLSKKHALDFYILGDYYKEWDIDTNSKGTRLFSKTIEKGFNTIVGAGYKFSF